LQNAPWEDQTWNWITFCDPVTRESSHPETQLTLFYNELPMSTYVADKRLQWARGFQFLSLFGVCTLLESKILKIIY